MSDAIGPLLSKDVSLALSVGELNALCVSITLSQFDFIDSL